MHELLANRDFQFLVGIVIGGLIFGCYLIYLSRWFR